MSKYKIYTVRWKDGQYDEKSPRLGAIVEKKLVLLFCKSLIVSNVCSVIWDRVHVGNHGNHGIML